MELHFNSISGQTYTKKFSNNDTVQDAINFLIQEIGCNDCIIFILSKQNNKLFYENNERIQTIAKTNQSFVFYNLNQNNMNQTFHDIKIRL